jgi:hypothetical protein
MPVRFSLGLKICLSKQGWSLEVDRLGLIKIGLTYILHDNVILKLWAYSIRDAGGGVQSLKMTPQISGFHFWAASIGLKSLVWPDLLGLSWDMRAWLWQLRSDNTVETLCGEEMNITAGGWQLQNDSSEMTAEQCAACARAECARPAGGALFLH